MQWNDSFIAADNAFCRCRKKIVPKLVAINIHDRLQSDATGGCFRKSVVISLRAVC
jgi:hypothetical protein